MQQRLTNHTLHGYVIKAVGMLMPKAKIKVISRYRSWIDNVRTLDLFSLLTSPFLGTPIPESARIECMLERTDHVLSPIPDSCVFAAVGNGTIGQWKKSICEGIRTKHLGNTSGTVLSEPAHLSTCVIRLFAKRGQQR